MRLSAVTRMLTILSIALLVGYGYMLEVRALYWPVWPIEWQTVAEFGFLVSAFVALVLAGLAGHLARNTYSILADLGCWNTYHKLFQEPCPALSAGTRSACPLLGQLTAQGRRHHCRHELLYLAPQRGDLPHHA